MVVVPTANHVDLHYGYTGVDLAAIVLTLLGIAGVVLLARAGAVTVAPPTRFWGRAERPDLYPPAARPEPSAVPDEAVGPQPNPILEWFDQFGPALPAEGDDSVLAPEPGAHPPAGTEESPADTLRPDADEPPDQ
jgi:hypothetical protein